MAADAGHDSAAREQDEIIALGTNQAHMQPPRHAGVVRWRRQVNIVHIVFSFFFFFQAEDGIRDLTVTGVQTCALPISMYSWSECAPSPTAPRPSRVGMPRAPEKFPSEPPPAVHSPSDRFICFARDLARSKSAAHILCSRGGRSKPPVIFSFAPL